jgi:hypothetical protein
MPTINELIADLESYADSFGLDYNEELSNEDCAQIAQVLAYSHMYEHFKAEEFSLTSFHKKG